MFALIILMCSYLQLKYWLEQVWMAYDVELHVYKTQTSTSTAAGAGRAWVKPGIAWRYLDRWSLLDTWANQDQGVVGMGLGVVG